MCMKPSEISRGDGSGEGAVLELGQRKPIGINEAGTEAH